MSQTIEQLCKELNQEQIQQLIQSLVCMKSTEIEGQVEIHDVNNVNKANMASYSNALTGKNGQTDDNNDKNSYNDHNSQDQTHSPNNSQSSDRVKPFFLLDEDVHGKAKPARSLWRTNVEIYKAISLKVHAGCIKGIQRIRSMWRIYMDNEEDRLSLLIQGLNLRGRQISLHPQNPCNPSNLQPDTIRIKVKNVPLSADDEQIHRALTLTGCNIQDLSRERLRVDGKVTNCQTGDRLVISKLLDNPIPRDLTIGKYYAKIFHPGQPEFSYFNNSPNSTSLDEKICHKCLTKGHFMQHCPNDWVCKSCYKSGHRMMDCTKGFSENENVQENEVNDEHTHSKLPSAQVPILSDVSMVSDKAVKTKNTSKSDKDGQTMKSTTKTVKIADSDVQHVQEKSTKSQQSIAKFVKTPSGQTRPDPKARTPPTPPERLHDKNSHNRIQKKQNTGKT